MTPRPSDLIISLAGHPAGGGDLDRLRDLPGVDRVHIDEHQTWLLITFDRAVIDQQTIVAELDAGGFRVASVQFYDERSS